LAAEDGLHVSGANTGGAMSDIVVERIMDDLHALANFGARTSGGVDRPSYSERYRGAVDWLSIRCREAGMRVRHDAAGNLIARLGPEEGPAVVTGSHIDSVPDGDIYDGALGVLAGVECARLFAEQADALPVAFEVVAFADEEGAYLSLSGSRAMAGNLEAEQIEMARGRDGDPLVEAMRRYGLDPMNVAVAERPSAEIAA
jgi:N-carbamoyl-L-amino-acid hydrolase